MVFEVTLVDGSVEVVEGAETVVVEGPFTTFLGTERQPAPGWSTKLASYRTERIVGIRRVRYRLGGGRRS
jgi:hypothetical protein